MKLSVRKWARQFAAVVLPLAALCASPTGWGRAAADYLRPSQTSAMPRTPAVSEKPAPPTERNRIFFLMGQSNMVGHASLPNPPDRTSARLLLFGNDYRWHCSGAMFCQVVQNPVEPIDSPIGQLDVVSMDDGRHTSPLIAAFGPSQALGMRWLDTHPQDSVTLVPCAADNSSIRQWLPDSDRMDRSTLYGSCNHRRTLVLPEGSPQCVIFDQGESDVTPADSNLWGERFAPLVDAIRTDFGADIPIVIRKLSDAQTGYDRGLRDTVAAQQVAASQHLYRVGMVTCEAREGCATFDSWHFIPDSYRTIGRRMADACEALLGTPRPTPQPVATPSPAAH